MIEMESFWSYEENGEKLMCTTMELEKLKSEALGEMRKSKDYIKQLIHLIKHAIQERDEARNQFQKLLNESNSTPDVVDQASLIINNLANGTILLQKGKLLHAVLQAGPLLHTLLMAGPLPMWRNPPLRIPHFSMNQLSCASIQVQTLPMLSFGHALHKRQRFC